MIVPSILSGEKGKVSVWLDETTPRELKQFHCVVCGKVVFEYYTNAHIILPGEMEEAGRPPIVVQCHGVINTFKDGQSLNSRCKTKYWIQ